MKLQLITAMTLGIVAIVFVLILNNPVFAVLPQSSTEQQDLNPFINDQELIQLSFDNEHQVTVGEETYIGTDIVIDPQTLVDGTQEIEWRAVEDFGIAKLTTPDSQSITVTKDTTPPVRPDIETSVIPKVTHFESSIPFNLLNKDSEYDILVNGLENENLSLSLKPGENTFSIQYKDQAGNVSPASEVSVNNIADPDTGTIQCEPFLSLVYPKTSLQPGFSGFLAEETSAQAKSFIESSQTFNCDAISALQVSDALKQIGTLFPTNTFKNCFDCDLGNERYISIWVGPEEYEELKDPFIFDYIRADYTTESGVEGFVESGRFDFPGLSPDVLYPPNYSFRIFSFKLNNRTVQIRSEWNDFEAQQTAAGQDFYKDLEVDFNNLINTLIIES